LNKTLAFLHPGRHDPMPRHSAPVYLYVVSLIIRRKKFEQFRKLGRLVLPKILKNPSQKSYFISQIDLKLCREIVSRKKKPQPRPQHKQS
jgi:hypothetical protein